MDILLNNSDQGNNEIPQNHPKSSKSPKIEASKKTFEFFGNFVNLRFSLFSFYRKVFFQPSILGDSGDFG